MAQNPEKYQIILIGETGVGKTSLIFKLLYNTFATHRESTIGVDFYPRNLIINDNDVQFAIFDTAGQERFKSITKNYLRNAKGIMILFDFTSLDSFKKVDDWLNIVQDIRVDDVPKILVGNKSDLLIDPKFEHQIVKKSEVEQFAQEHNIEYIETSAKSGENVEAAFILLGELIMKQPTPVTEQKQDDTFKIVDISDQNSQNEGGKKPGCCKKTE